MRWTLALTNQPLSPATSCWKSIPKMTSSKCVGLLFLETNCWNALRPGFESSRSCEVPKSRRISSFMRWSSRVEAHQRGCPYCHDARIAWSREACVRLLHSSAFPYDERFFQIPTWSLCSKKPSNYNLRMKILVCRHSLRIFGPIIGSRHTKYVFIQQLLDLFWRINSRLPLACTSNFKRIAIYIGVS